MIASRVPLKNYGRVLLPALAILIFIWVCNSIPFDAARSLNARLYVVHLARYHGELRITFTTTPRIDRCARIHLAPFARTQKVPVDDIAFTLSLALRFIPLLFEQLGRIKIAQTSRGAQFGSGLRKRLKTWMVVLIPLFIGFFRQADSVVEAMDARCYGAEERTSLNAQMMRASAWVVLAAALFAVCVPQHCSSEMFLLAVKASHSI